MDQAQMIKGILEGCVLRLVEGRFCYSQEIVNLLRANGFPTMSGGTLFPLLLRLEKNGYFETEMVPTGTGPSRKYYRLNETGREALAQFRRQWSGLKQIVDAILEGSVEDGQRAEDETEQGI